MSQGALSFVLLVSGTEAADLELLSASLSTSDSNQFRLGDGCLPHLTLLQFAADPSEAAGLWEEAEGTVRVKSMDIVLAGFCILPAPDDSEVWMEIPVLNSESLRQAQQDLMGLTAVRDREIFNGTGDNFRPHVTVGLFERIPDTLRLGRIRGGHVRRRVKARLALGVTGSNYSLVKVLSDAEA